MSVDHPALLAKMRAQAERESRRAERRSGPVPVAVGESPLPPLGRQAANLASAFARTAAAAASGSRVKVPPDVQEARLRVCRQGEGLSPDQVQEGRCDRYRRSDGRCAECGCWVGAKATLAAERCPLGRWETWRPPEES